MPKQDTVILWFLSWPLPIISDSNFLKPLVALARAIGIEVKLITGDEGYNDSDGSFYKETGVHLITPASSKVCVPEHVDPETMEVFYNEFCEIPMQYIGCEEQHEFRCGASPGECPLSGKCPQCRLIPIDSGFFQRIPYETENVLEALEIRKNAERPFNLLKNREGLEKVRARSQHTLTCPLYIYDHCHTPFGDSGNKEKRKEYQPPDTIICQCLSSILKAFMAEFGVGN